MLHLAVDPLTHDIVAAEVSLENVHDSDAQFTAAQAGHHLYRYMDGAYDSKASHQLLIGKGEFKQLMAGKISLRKYNGQVGEVIAYKSAINELNNLGLPVRKPKM